MEKLLHQMEKEITFLHEELKGKNTILRKDNHNNENRSIYSNNDVKITQSEKNNTKSTQSIETVERESTSTEPLKIIVNESDTRSRKTNQHYTGDKSSNLSETVMSQKRGTNRKKALIVDAIVKNIDGWRLNKKMKSSVAVKSIAGATIKNMRRHIKGCLEDNSPDSVVLHVGTNNIKNKESIEDIANNIMDDAIFIRIEKTNVFVSDATVRNDRLNDKGKNVNSLLKCRCDEEKICFVDNTNINV